MPMTDSFPQKWAAVEKAAARLSSRLGGMLSYRMEMNPYTHEWTVSVSFSSGTTFRAKWEFIDGAAEMLWRQMVLVDDQMRRRI